MKNLSLITIPFVLSLLFSVSSIAQNSQDVEFNSAKVEVNIAVANIFSKDNLSQLYYIDMGYYPYGYSNYFVQPELVVGVKLHTAKGAFRLGTNFAYSNNTTERDEGYLNKYTFKNFGSKLNLGYEWHSLFNRVLIYYGFDLSTSYTSYYTNHEYESVYEPSQSTTDETTIDEVTVGINPLIGVNIFITPHLSIGTEAKFTTEYVSGKVEYKTNDNLNNDNSSSSGIRTRFGPIGFLSVNLYF
jgi:hypothetical protein